MVCRVAQPVGLLSKHWMIAKALTQTRAWPHPFFIHHFTLKWSLTPLHRLSKITTRIGIQQQGDVSDQWLRVRYRAIHVSTSPVWYWPESDDSVRLGRKPGAWRKPTKQLVTRWGASIHSGPTVTGSPISWTSGLFSFHSCVSRTATVL